MINRIGASAFRKMCVLPLPPASNFALESPSSHELRVLLLAPLTYGFAATGRSYGRPGTRSVFEPAGQI